MPKALDSKLIEAIKRAYLNRSDRPSLQALAEEFNVGQTSIKTLCRKEGWAKLREGQEKGLEQGAKTAAALLNAPAPKLNDLDVLDKAINMMLGSAAVTEARSQEGCANALSNLIKTKRELFPPSVDELAEIAVRQGISAADFLDAIRRRWEQNEPQDSPPKPSEINSG